jgi:thymidine kinase|uniref:thymidine kinase n=1 Tax=viral metagenome TaxID=1070528 RepID=A0A6C0I7A6_9ZZZZ
MSDNQTKLGNIQLILGCMFSGKTSELIRRIQRYKSIQKRVLFVNYIEDTRYTNQNTNNIYTHDKVGCQGVYLDKLNGLIDILKNYDVFVINEGQFFEDIYNISILLCEKHGKDVLICGLDGDFQRQTFKYNLLDLIPYADTVEILTAYCSICKDETPARFSKRITNETEQKIIGSDNYIPVCRKHYFN